MEPSRSIEGPRALSLLQIWTLALVQGFTEFLPVSSSAHLILVSSWLRWPDEGLLFDVALHGGTLLSVLVYYGRTLLKLVLSHKWGLLYWSLSAVPVGLTGFLGHSFIESHFRSVDLVALTTLFGAFLLGLATLLNPSRTLSHPNPNGIPPLPIWMGMGLAQVLALIPGVSRSGITLTAGLALGLPLQQATRVSLWMGVPVIAAATGLTLKKLLKNPLVPGGDVMALLPAAALGFFLSFLFGLVAIATLLRLLDRFGVLPFVGYRLLLGIILLLQ